MEKTILLKIGLELLVNELPTIIGSHNFYFCGELSLNHGMKCLKNSEDFIFAFS